MKFCYANRRMTLYPNSVDPWDLAPEDYTDQFLKKVKDMGFDALEIGSDTLDKTGGSEKAVKEFTKRIQEKKYKGTHARKNIMRKQKFYINS